MTVFCLAVQYSRSECGWRCGEVFAFDDHRAAEASCGRVFRYAFPGSALHSLFCL